METSSSIGSTCNYKLIAYLILISVCYSCASYKPHTFGNGRNWENAKPSSNLIPKHAMYLVGDAGNSKRNDRKPAKNDTVPVLKYLKKIPSKDSEHSSVLFLGDNIYPSGMPPKPDTSDINLRKHKIKKLKLQRENAEYSISTQLDAVKPFKGYPIIIPGNHDWHLDKDFTNEQRKYVNNSLNSSRSTSGEDYFLPTYGNIGPYAKEIANNVVVIIIDSYNLIKLWNQKEKEGGTVGERFTIDFNKMIDTLQSKNVVIAMHHPPYTYGPHGGKFGFKQFLFPVTELIEKPSWVGYPLSLVLLGLGAVPFLKNTKTWLKIATGTVSVLTLSYTFGRKTVRWFKGDVDHRYYQEYKNALLTGVENKGRFTFVSGHEHTLQYLENENHNFIVSGSGSKTHPVGKGEGLLFSSASNGYSKLSFFEDGETWVTFYGFEKRKFFQCKNKVKKEPIIIFQKKIKEKTP
ncbi:metallophosphoesterase [Dyadobacter sp. MSC1_007]|jgi:hypothetical protein|uniref:metallophosphoesterase n=1 Tax=Dyadobacter sp. MSC1_007 TaxID=2909264 RepID=UPI00202E0CA8|nr:metallophosphoesterase [Dyadobacter sp. MSC1_007]